MKIRQILIETAFIYSQFFDIIFEPLLLTNKVSRMLTIIGTGKNTLFDFYIMIIYVQLGAVKICFYSCIKHISLALYLD